MKKSKLGIARAMSVTLILLLLLTACTTSALEKSISMEAIYPNPNQSNVTIFYTVPPPPPGKVYVLWIVNPDKHEAVNAGQVSGGHNITVHAMVNFEAVGAVVSIEDQPNPASMSHTWALKVGTVTPTTPTPGVTSTPSAGSTPSANPTPAAASSESTNLTHVFHVPLY
ncbi:MAG TPA: anti-sigma factor [Chloroflexota bacterium]|nr:anti-sigma factor [Chloroflexota bacterium]